MRVLRPFLLLIPALASCASWMPEPPQFSVDTPLGRAYAHSPERASHLVDTWMRMADEIQAQLPGAKEDEQLDVWLMAAEDIPDPFDIGHPMGGITYSTDGDAWLIQVPDTHKLEWILAHELTHALVGPDWETLGGTLEEGLCEYVAALHAPSLLPVRQLQVHMGAAALFGHDKAGMFFSQARRAVDGEIEIRWVGEKGRLPEQVWTESDLRYYLEQPSIAPFPEVRAGLQRIGTFLVFRIVERHGLTGLHRLCQQAREQGYDVVPFGWTMDAAGFDLGPGALHPLDEQIVEALVEPLGWRALHQQLRDAGPEFGRYIASEYAPHFEGYDGEHFVRFSQGTLRSADGTRLPLFEVSNELRKATRIHWPVREQTAEVIDLPYSVIRQ